ncbi:acyl-CoA synthetase like protein [Zymoseptoria brevis]|uniref:medium-chain acyl-CoA ligase n=1 Tax=Zymoseptoria brevis TaxID=1047168 RepID=A0A0F4G836_9PEZI|nr:acyl-CoA synthetase like protein [Zymoseptoria brevis]
MAHYHSPQLTRPESFNFATDVVDYWAAHPPPGNIAMHWISPDQSSERKLSFEYFSRQSHRLAILFREKLGVQKGEKMLIIMPRVAEWWEIATASIRSGIVLCPATTLLVASDIQYRINRSEASVFLGDTVAVSKLLRVREQCPSIKHIFQVDGATAPPPGVTLLSEALRSIPAEAKYTGPKPDVQDPAIIYFTSGTTGPPKMVQHSQISYPLAQTITGKYFHRLQPGDLNWVLTEQGWAKAGWAFFGSWNCGAALFIHDDRMAFDPKTTLDILHAYPITTFCAPPTVYRQLVLDANRKHFSAHSPKALKHCTGAGEPLNPEVIRLWWETSGLQICDGFGQTETVLVCGNFAGSEIRPGSMGRPSPGVPLFVIDDEGRETRDGEEGDIALKVDLTERGDFFGVFDGYLDEDGRLDRKLREGKEEGVAWYCTGDRARRDREGYLWFVGRNDDVINSSGYRIGPFEVESTLKQHPAVVESAVISSPDENRGEVVKAFVVLTAEAEGRYEDALRKELQDFCKEHAAPYKYPRKVQFVKPDFLPKTISGKIQRKKLKAMEWEEGEGGMKAKL